MVLVDIALQFSNEDTAREYLEKKRWPDGTVCPHCDMIGESYHLIAKKTGSKRTARKGLWKCRGCRKQLTVTVGTIFESTRIRLHKWLIAFHLICSGKKGMSAHQLHRMLRITYKTAWFMAHRIRYAMAEEPLSSKLSGIVEIDETYVGGKRQVSMSRAVKPGERPKDRLGPVADKAAAVSVLKRGGGVQSRYVEGVTSQALEPILNQMVSGDARIMADSSSSSKDRGQGPQTPSGEPSCEEIRPTRGCLVPCHEHC